ncbi:MAG: protein involved in biosynthesis of mitomycin antibiotics/polyketide fumonisin [Ilumatobacteraceae bacterium]|nr:protein involved in biosynthesis of mitomycin antibiotics/polyketide fumonisin [Ilumatobacteraceae bacterium]
MSTSFASADAEAVAFYREHGWVLIDTLDAHGVDELRRWVDEIAGWADGAGEWLHYREQTDHGPRLCRTENFVPMHAGMRSLLTGGAMLDAASALLGEPAVLYKEKINYKLAGGAGYAPHQDAPAYPFIATHVSCMVAVDDSDVANGCLEVVSARHCELLPVDDVGCIRAGAVASMQWEPAPVRAGQTLWFHSRTPHRSAANASPFDRRALYPTYNAATEGDLRAAYYREKLDRMANAQVGDGVQVSLIGDFQGRPVG